MPPPMALLPAVSSNPIPNRVPPQRLPRLCVALEASQAAELFAKAERAARDNSLLELRLDHLKNPALAVGKLRDFADSHPLVTLIATCRKVQAGGKFRGSAEAECAILSKAALAGCAWVDLSLTSAERLSANSLRQLRLRANLLISLHDFAAPRHLATLEARLRAVPADLYKVVCQARNFADNGKILRFLEQAGARLPLVAFCMGEAGAASRILAPRFGAAFTFASMAPGQATAPGQLDIATLRRIYRIESINRATRVYGVLGYPLEHSLSPLMLNAAFRRASVNAVYLPMPAKQPGEVLSQLDALELSGFSVTHPHKSALLKELDGIDPVARRIGAINTVVRSNGKLYGYNTDLAGIVGPLESLARLDKARVLILGAGGAARAAAFGLAARGAEIYICNRTPAKAQTLARQAHGKAIARRELKKASFDVIVNATPVGQYPHVDASPLGEDEIHASIVFDLVYNPLETKLLRLARERGARPIAGLEMFVTQGARQFEIWTGKPAPREEMLREVLTFLQTGASPA